MTYNILRKGILLVVSLLITSCSYLGKVDDVLPDNRTEYQKSQSLPDLEIPPDLTIASLDESFAIPGEDKAMTLSSFKKDNTIPTGKTVTTTQLPTLGNTENKWIVTQGTEASVWPKLQEFWLTNGFALDIADPELGVLETEFKDISVDDVITRKEKFKILSEAGDIQGELILLITSEIETKVTDEADSEWVKQTDNDAREKELITQLNLHLNGTLTTETSVELDLNIEPDNSSLQAELVDLSNDKQYLLIPSEFSKAWSDLEVTIKTIGLYVESQEQEKGIYSVIYYNTPQDKKTLANKLMFWKNNENDSKPFKISMAGVGNNTEVIILDANGDWSSSDDANQILNALKEQYNTQ